MAIDVLGQRRATVAPAVPRGTAAAGSVRLVPGVTVAVPRAIGAVVSHDVGQPVHPTTSATDAGGAPRGERTARAVAGSAGAGISTTASVAAAAD
jgi:hypothetical protein